MQCNNQNETLLIRSGIYLQSTNQQLVDEQNSYNSSHPLSACNKTRKRIEVSGSIIEQ